MLFPLVLASCVIAALTAPQVNFYSSKSPNPARCAHRKIHETYNGHGYLFTWEEPKTVGLQLGWTEAREFCRARCMDLVSLESQEENDFIKERVSKANQNYVWTSGRKCNFKGCERPDLQPVSVYGWFWTGSLSRMPATTDRLDSDWSDNGGFGRPQPDDREHFQGGPEEECLAILNNLYDDGIHWHDIACKHRMPFICEDSDELLQILQRTALNSTNIDLLVPEKLAVFDDKSQRLIPPFPLDMHEKEESGLRSAQGSLVPASSDAVANAVAVGKESGVFRSSFAPVVPATQHTVMMVSEMPAIPIISEDGRSEDLVNEEKLGLFDRNKSM
ncbi:C-type lectin [Frankliniella occidentalis]|uniref:Uncharacterized protein LOC113204560 n=1 Tax=Frankliniella occidentalis TaxID=133901 RepID=A0A6J1S4G4_FRAOC|nr:uncharacterized protein LOC113204560 [Frankliniella occidentalis]KAE8749902.1 C-type lectin [Frankliniella occidentalis]